MFIEGEFFKPGCLFEDLFFKFVNCKYTYEDASTHARLRVAMRGCEWPCEAASSHARLRVAMRGCE